MAVNQRRYKVLLETLPKWALISTLALFAVLSVSSFLIGVFGAPKVYFMDMKTHTVNASFFGGAYNITHDLNNTSPLNQELTFIVQLSTLANATAAIQKNDVYYGVSLLASDTGIEPFAVYNHDNIEHVRSLYCEQDSTRCSPRSVVRTRLVAHSFFKATLRLTNLDYLYQRGFLNTTIVTSFLYVNPDYTVFEFVFRYLFIAVTLVVLCIFSVATFRRQRFADWHTEQKWVLVLLVALVFYNNPMYPLDFLAGTWVFPLLTSVFVVNFTAILLFVLIVMTHAALKPPQERTILGFYFLKVVIVGAVWLLALIPNVYQRVTESLDSASEFTEIPFFMFIVYALLAAVGVYALFLAYYVARLLAVIRTLSKKNSQRFQIVWGLTFFVLVVSLAMYLSVYISGLFIDAAFLFTHSIFTIYPIFLAFLFFPTRQYDEVDDI